MASLVPARLDDVGSARLAFNSNFLSDGESICALVAFFFTTILSHFSLFDPPLLAAIHSSLQCAALTDGTSVALHDLNSLSTIVCPIHSGFANHFNSILYSFVHFILFNDANDAC